MIDKNNIPYNEIAKTDKLIVKLIKLLNAFPYWATVQCCQGHPFEWKHYPEYKRGQNPKNFARWSASLYITFEVYNEIMFLELSKRIQTKTDGYFHVTKSYDWNEFSRVRWRWGMSFSGQTKSEVRKPLLEARKIILDEVMQFMREYNERPEH